MTSHMHTQQLDTNNRDGKTIVTCSAVGGAGRTTITVNLAALLAERKIKTVVMDADLQFGDIALALDLQPTLTIKEAAERNDIAHISDYYTSTKTGIELLAAPNRPEYAELVTTDMLAAVTDSIRAKTEVLLIETQHGLTEQSLLLMEKADQILVVTTPGMAALKNTKLMVETLTTLGLKEKISLIVNKSTIPSVIKASDIPELTQVQSTYFLPDDSKHVAHSLDVGIPLVTSSPKLDFSKGMQKIANELFPYQPPASKQNAVGGLLGKAGKKVKALKIRREKDEFIGQITNEESRASETS